MTQQEMRQSTEALRDSLVQCVAALREDLNDPPQQDLKQCIQLILDAAQELPAGEAARLCESARLELLEVMKNGERGGNVRGFVAQQLVRFGPAGCALLAHLVEKGDDVDTRFIALEALRESQAADEAAMKAFTLALKGGDDRIQRTAAFALVEAQAGNDAEIVSVLVEQLASGNPAVELECAAKLLSLHQRVDESLEVVRRHAEGNEGLLQVMFAAGVTDRLQSIRFLDEASGPKASLPAEDKPPRGTAALTAGAATMREAIAGSDPAEDARKVRGEEAQVQDREVLTTAGIPDIVSPHSILHPPHVRNTPDNIGPAARESEENKGTQKPQVDVATKAETPEAAAVVQNASGQAREGMKDVLVFGGTGNWFPTLNWYRGALVALQFETYEGAVEAIELLNNDERLRGCPKEYLPGWTVLIPKLALPVIHELKARKVAFKERRVVSGRDVPYEKLVDLRAQQGMFSGVLKRK